MKKSTQAAFIAKVLETTRRYNLFQPGARLLVGVSGGPDSVALLHVLHAIAREWKLDLRAVHVNHHLRGKESEQDEQFVKRLCADLGIALRCEHIHPMKLKKERGGSLEDICRTQRYAIFLKVASDSGAQALVLGHHKDDLAETILMRLMRGAGSGGLSAFAPKTHFGDLTVVRPFYDVSREEIVSFLRLRGATWRIDSSNRDKRFLRNKIRLQLIPYLERRFNPNIVETLARSARALREDDEALSTQTGRLFSRIARMPNDCCMRFWRRRLETLAPHKLNRLLHYALKRLSPKHLPPEMSSVALVADLFATKPTGDIVRLPDNVVAYLSYDELVIVRLPSLPRRISKRAIMEAIGAHLTDAEMSLLMGRRQELRIERTDLKEGEPLERTIGDLRVMMSKGRCTPRLREQIRARTLQEPGVEYFDAAAIEFPLTVRTRRAGDVFHPFGAPGKKKLKDFLIDQKIPAHVRSKIPLLCHGKTVLSAVGYRRSDVAKIHPNTKEVIRVQVTLSPLA